MAPSKRATLVSSELGSYLGQYTDDGWFHGRGIKGGSGIAGQPGNPNNVYNGWWRYSGFRPLSSGPYPSRISDMQIPEPIHDGTARAGTFIGSLKDGKKHGVGVMKYTDGSVYEGVWYEDKENGCGVLTDSSGKEIHGKWVGGELIETY
jgi:hypothetical protein